MRDYLPILILLGGIIVGIIGGVVGIIFDDVMAVVVAYALLGLVILLLLFKRDRKIYRVMTQEELVDHLIKNPRTEDEKKQLLKAGGLCFTDKEK